MSSYLPPYEVLLQILGISGDQLRGSSDISVNPPALMLLIKQALHGIPFDGELYAKNNPDVAKVYGSRDTNALRRHFIERGYIEGRQVPYAGFDPEYYAAKNSDVVKSYLAGELKSLYNHYAATGINEFRAPSAEVESSVAGWADLSRRKKLVKN
jgi:hypothetical protein